MQTKYKTNGMEWTDDYTKLRITPKPGALEPDCPLEFWYDTDKTTSNLVKQLEHMDQWIKDPVVFIMPDSEGNSRFPPTWELVPNPPREETYEGRMEAAAEKPAIMTGTPP